LIWPQAVQTLYPGLSYDRIGTLAGLVAMGFVFGQLIGGFVATVFGARASVIGPMMIAGPLLCACAANPLNMELTMGLITSGALFIGMAEAQAATTSTFSIRTQEEIGVAGGLSGTIRSFGSVIATAVYTATLTNRLSTTIPHYVVPAAVNAGLPVDSVDSLIIGLQGKGLLTPSAVPGLTPAINATAAAAFRVANSEAYKTVFLVSFAFSGLGMILCWFVTDNDKSMEEYVAGHVHKKADEAILETQDIVARD
jgi:MFS family permease